MRKTGSIILTLCLIICSFLGTVQIQAVEADNKTVLNVLDFGADPSGQHDSTNAVKAALEKAKTLAEPVKIDFPKGEYHFWKDYATKRNYHTSNTSSLSYPEKSIAILLEDMQDVEFDGNDSTLIMHGDMMALASVNSKNIAFKNFVLDYKDADTVDISVVGTGVNASNQAYTDFYVPANYNYKIAQNGMGITWQGEISPVTGKPYWETQNADFVAMLVIYKAYDQTVARSSNKAASNPFKDIANIAEVRDNVLRFTYNGNRPLDQEEGNIFLLCDSATRKTTGAFFWESEDILVENIDVHYLSGFGWLTQMCKNVEFNSVNFLPRYGSGKFTTSNADQLHVAGCGGYFNVVDCNFSVAHDDPINIHGSYMRVEEVIDNRTLRLAYINGQQGGFRQFHPGDEVLFYSRTYLETADGESEDDPFIVASSIAPGEEYNGTNLNMRTEIVTFEKDFSKETLDDLKEKIQVGSETQSLYVAENITYTPEVNIRGNHMKSIPTRGILCTTRKPVIIEDNVFDNMAMANIYLSNDADYWYESGPIRDMIIRNNEFYIRPTGQAEWGNVSGIFVDPVVVHPSAGSNVPPKKGDSTTHKNIIVDGNTFHMANDNAVTAQGVDNMIIKNNTIIRDQPGLELSLEANGSLEVGKTQMLKLNTKEKTLSKDVFKFTDCKNILIENNTYDNGFNLNVTTAGGMKADDITIHDNMLTLNKAGGNMKRTTDNISFATSNPEIAYVNEQGELTGVSDGTVDVYAYTTWNGTIIKSQPIRVIIGSGESGDLQLESDVTFFQEANTTTTLKTNHEDVTYEVLDPVTLQASNAASIDENGIYTALKDGTVLVRASSADAQKTLLMVHSFPYSYGDVNSINEQVLFENKHPDKLFGNEQHKIGIVAETGSELYGNQKKVNNLVKFKIPNEYKDDLRIQVDVDGLPVRASGWNNAGIMLFKDGDNYYSIGKKSHFQGVVTVYEQGASAMENGGSSDDNTLTASTFEIEVVDGFATLRYTNANGEWQTANYRNVRNIMGDDVYLAFASWLNGGDPLSTTFNNIKIAKASETTTEDMSAVEPLTIFDAFDNARPVVSDVHLADGNVNTAMEVNYSAKDDGSIDHMLYAWTLTDINGVANTYYTKDATFTPKKEGTLQVDVIALDNYQKPSMPVTSKAVQIIQTYNEDDALQNFYINGTRIEGFDADTYAYEVTIPASLENIRVSYDQEDAFVQTTIKDRDDNILAKIENDNEAIIPVTEEISIERGNKTYLVKFNRVEDNATSISEIRIDDTLLDLSKVIKPGTKNYFLEIDNENPQIHIETADTSTLDLTRSFYQHPVSDDNAENNVFDGVIALTAGINAIQLNVIAADGITTNEVTLYLFKAGFTDTDLENIAVNGEAIEGFDSGVHEYTLYVNEPSDITIEADAKEEAGQQTTITKDRVSVQDTSATFKLHKGLNKISIANKAKNIWDVAYYTLNVIVVEDDNADLLQLTSDELLSPIFDPQVAAYDIQMSKDSLTLRAQTQVKDAKIKMSTAYEKVEAQSSIEHTFAIYNGENTVKIDVVAKDGITTKSYILRINARGYTYASDMQEVSGVVGYGTLGKNISTSGGQIALMDENMQRVAFEKGLGAHAISSITYDISDQGYERFEAFVGVDYYQVNQGSAASVDFTVLVDNQVRFKSGVMTVRSPMQKVDIDVSGASTIVLLAGDAGDGIGFDHADWADAKFARPLPEAPAIEEENAFAKDILQGAITKAKDFMASDAYISVSPYVKEAFKTTLATAEQVYADKGATVIECLDAWHALAKVLQYSDFKADKAKLEELIAECDAIDLSAYTQGVEAFKTALTEAKDTAADELALQDRIDNAYRTLLIAKEGLSNDSETVDKATLESIINAVEGVMLQKDKYVQNTQWDTFEAALNQANDVLADEHADQASVNAAIKALTNAYEELRLIPDEALLRQLSDFISFVSQIQRAYYRASDLMIIDEVQKQAQQMFDSKDFTKQEMLIFQPQMAEVMSIINNNRLSEPVNDTQNEALSTSAKTYTTRRATTTKTGDSTNVMLLWGITLAAGAYTAYTLKKAKQARK